MLKEIYHTYQNIKNSSKEILSLDSMFEDAIQEALSELTEKDLIPVERDRSIRTRPFSGNENQIMYERDLIIGEFYMICVKENSQSQNVLVPSLIVASQIDKKNKLLTYLDCTTHQTRLVSLSDLSICSDENGKWNHDNILLKVEPNELKYAGLFSKRFLN